jgi:hypothetical protein
MTVFLVCGFGRCGSSLAMQMLDAGGYPVTVGPPDYEDDIAKNKQPSLRDWADKDEHAIKILDPHLIRFPDFSFRAVWLDRDPAEQAKSFAKFLHFMAGVSVGRAGRKAFISGYRHDRPKALATLRSITGAPVPIITFEAMIMDPHGSACHLARIAGSGLDIAAMAAVVRKRGTACYPTMLEAELLG